MQNQALCDLHEAGKSRSVPMCPLWTGTFVGKSQLISVSGPGMSQGREVLDLKLAVGAYLGKEHCG